VPQANNEDEMRRGTFAKQFAIGIILGALIAHSTANGQWTVHDPAQYALQVKKKIEEANRWIVTVNQYARMYEKAVQQVTTLRGILRTTEDLVAKQRNMIATMSSIGQTVRGVFFLKNQLEALVVTRLRTLKAINDRLRNGIFDPQADLRDFEEYLRISVGRTSQDTVANMERLARMDNQLERLHYELQMARARRAGTEKQKKEATANLQKELSKPEAERCAPCISDLKQEVSNCDLLIAHLDSEIARLLSEIEKRAKKYNVILEDQQNFGQQVKAMDEAWTGFNGAKDNLSNLLNEIEGRRPRRVEP
jgi:chromosome segregation ATPase